MIIVSEEEKNILQEIMNIAVGNAAGDLGEVIDIYVLLNVPNIRIMKGGDIAEYLLEKRLLLTETSIVTQYFWGDFKGSAILVFPGSAGKDMIDILENDLEDFNERPIASLEKEVLIEIGNIIIGACVGKISELLNTFVTYSPPHVVHESDDNYSNFVKTLETDQAVIAMETIFRFEEKDITGFLLIATSHESVEWLRKAMYEFMEPYNQ